jgi:hypothetical protein
MPESSRKDSCVESLSKLADALAKNEEFCSIVVKPSPDRAERLDAIIRTTAPSVGYPVSSKITCISQSFATLLSCPDPCDLSPDAARLQKMFSEYNDYKKRRYHLNKRVAKV